MVALLPESGRISKVNIDVVIDTYHVSPNGKCAFYSKYYSDFKI